MKAWTRISPLQQEAEQSRSEWRLWLLFWAVFLIGCTMAVTVASSADRSCDLESLKRYPMAYALSTRSIRIESPNLFFRAPDERLNYEAMLEAEGAARLRAALLRGLETFPPAERPILMLAAADSWTNAPDGLLTFFVLQDGVFVDDLLAILDAEGLAMHAALFREGKALFGPNYGTAKERYQRWIKGDFRDEAFERVLRNLSDRYRKLPRLMDEAVSRVEASSELTAIYEPLRASASDDDRLRFLVDRLMSCIQPYDDLDVVMERLAGLPPLYAQITVVSVFEYEMLNGSVHQAFFNSSGNLMPDVLEALKAWKLTEQAQAIQKGIDMFPSPYPRDLNQRRNFMAGKGDDFDNALYDLTGPVDDGAMHEAMIRLADQAGILPK